MGTVYRTKIKLLILRFKLPINMPKIEMAFPGKDLFIKSNLPGFGIKIPSGLLKLIFSLRIKVKACIRKDPPQTEGI